MRYENESNVATNKKSIHRDTLGPKKKDGKSAVPTGYPLRVSAFGKIAGTFANLPASLHEVVCPLEFLPDDWVAANWFPLPLWA